MKYQKPASTRELHNSFHLKCNKAADTLAEEKPHILQLELHEDPDIYIAQIRVFLCTKYGYSANNSAKIMEELLQVSIPQKRGCLSNQNYI